MSRRTRRRHERQLRRHRRAAVPASSCTMNPYLPWAVLGASTMIIRSKTTMRVLCKSHKFTVHKTTKGATWVYITDRNAEKTRRVSGKHVHRDVRMCRE
ncbi:SH3 domain-containing protein [Streptomyces sp. SID625]|nr:SH3 domain-containing protein [Streptomyces sp. SID625]